MESQAVVYALVGLLAVLAAFSIVVYFLSKNVKHFFKNTGERVKEIDFFLKKFKETALELNKAAGEKASLSDFGKKLASLMRKASGVKEKRREEARKSVAVAYAGSSSKKRR